MNLPQTVIRGVRMATTFTGRDTPDQFWPYAAAASASFVALGNAVSVIAFIATSGASRDARMLSLAVVAAIFGVLFVGLLAAAVARRLRDRGRNAGWALIPLGLLVVGFAVQVVVMMTIDDESGPGLFFVAFAVTVLYFATFIALIVQLALPRRTAA